MSINNLSYIKSKLLKNQVSIGGWMQISSTSIAEILSSSKFDWVVIDMEHGSFSTADLPDIFRAIKINNKSPFVRLGTNQFNLLPQVLESGAEGLVFSKIESKIILNTLISNSYYHPLGTRGVGHSNSNLFGKKLQESINKFKPFICAIIESEKGLNEIDDIVKSKYLDAIFIGPYDLSSSLGVQGKFDSKKYKESINKIIQVCKKNKISCGIHLIDNQIDSIKQLKKKGFNFIAYQTDAIFLHSAISKIKI